MDPVPEQNQPALASATAPTRPHIAALPNEVVERIAAGEVIERPVSVVRELLDNAVDAGASDIRVELREGGLRLIRVSDNGCGIHAEDLPLACQPHATSKIATLDDLARLSTLGFRGEALASIAKVAELEILSASEPPAPASGVTISPSESAPTRWLAARERGTTVAARHLFRAIPARQAVLSAPSIEKLRCLQAIRAYARAHPSIRFTVVADGELVMQSPGTGAHDALVALFGADVAAGVLSFAASPLPDATITGYVSARQHTGSTRDDVLLIVNGRLITNRSLLAATEAGYRPLLHKGRHPLLLASITVPPDWIDANTHPTKAEVLLRHDRDIARALREAIHDALGAAPASVSAPLPRAARFHPQPSLRFPPRGRARPRPSAVGRALLRERAGAYGQTIASPLSALAQLNDTLILARGGNGELYLVDQHRAHERVLYDQIGRRSAALASGAPPHESSQLADFPVNDAAVSVVDGYMKDLAGVDTTGGQLLLEPQLIELSPLQARQLSSRLHELDALGLSLQPFGGQVFLARSVPSLLGAAHTLSAHVRELAIEASVDSDDWLDHLRASLACRAAIRRGQSLSPGEQQALLADLQNASASAVCPHGSPIALALPPDYLADVFEW